MSVRCVSDTGAAAARATGLGRKEGKPLAWPSNWFWSLSTPAAAGVTALAMPEERMEDRFYVPSELREQVEECGG